MARRVAFGRMQAFLFVGFVVLALGWRAQALGSEVGLDWKIKELSTKPSVLYKGPVTILCSWTATVAKTGNFNKASQWTGLMWLGSKKTHSFLRYYAPNHQSYLKPGTYPWAPRIATNEPSDFGGSEEFTFQDVLPGTHTIGCMVPWSSLDKVGQPATHESSSHLANNKKEITILVKSLKGVEPGDFPTSKPPQKSRLSGGSSVPQVGVKSVPMPRPKVTIRFLSGAIDKTCKDPYAYAHVEVGVVSDRPLAPSQGSVTVQDITPGAVGVLKSYKENVLPAVNVAVDGGVYGAVSLVKLGATVPPFSLVGNHNLLIFVKPKLVNGQPAFEPPGSPGLTIVSFPSGYCPQAKRVPPPTAPARRR